MPTRVEDYEVLYTIGTGSYGRCQKIRRKSDGKVSAGLVPASAPRPPRGSREPGGVHLKSRVLRRASLLPQICVCPGSLEGWEAASFFFFFLNL